MSEELPPKLTVESLTRTQILMAMGLTAVALLLAARLWLLLDRSAELLPVTGSGSAVLWGIGLGMTITLVSGIAYRVWESYRLSADYYLALVIKPFGAI